MAMSRGSQTILRRPGCVRTAAALPSILRLPEYWSFADPWTCPILVLSFQINRLSFFEEGPDAFVEFFGAAAQNLITVFHRNHGLDRSGVDTHVETFLRQPQSNR